jgi:hypothetical protein
VRRASCAGRSWHPSIGLTQVTAAFYHSRNGNKVALWTMAEIIEYRGYRLSVEPHAPGSKILIFPPGSSLPLPTILFQRTRTRLDGLIKDAKDIVDDPSGDVGHERSPKRRPVVVASLSFSIEAVSYSDEAAERGVRAILRAPRVASHPGSHACR